MLVPPAVPMLPTATRFVTRLGLTSDDARPRVSNSLSGTSVVTLRMPTAIQWNRAVGFFWNSARNCANAACRTRPWFIERSKSPWGRLLRVRVYSSAWGPVSVCGPSSKSRELVAFERVRDVDLEAAEGVEDPLEPVETGEHVVVEGDARQILDRADHPFHARLREGVVDLVRATARDRHVGVTGDPDERGSLRLGVDPEDMDRVAETALQRCAGARVAPDDQDEDRLVPAEGGGELGVRVPDLQEWGARGGRRLERRGAEPRDARRERGDGRDQAAAHHDGDPVGLGSSDAWSSRSTRYAKTFHSPSTGRRKNAPTARDLRGRAVLPLGVRLEPHLGDRRSRGILPVGQDRDRERLGGGRQRVIHVIRIRPEGQDVSVLLCARGRGTVEHTNAAS